MKTETLLQVQPQAGEVPHFQNNRYRPTKPHTLRRVNLETWNLAARPLSKEVV